MKAIGFALLLACGIPALAQTPPTQPGKGPDPGKLFQLPPGLDGRKPQFTLHVPDARQWLPQTVVPQQPAGRRPGGDDGIVRRPYGFAEQPSRPALSSNIYPDLKLLPIEMAQLDAQPAAPQPRAIPIPRTWPNAKLEPIPTRWQNYRMVPLDAIGKK